ncbi:AraC family transcriptional regulator ligand-binding domain-containing protein [Ruegeria pomeroyi]|uniref:AraC family transcriptional regulator ligand-binding domain-containing protein n=1 Tax=Ruegeria pomeroyi TaxID=89184 RepID=A0A9Q3WPY0_9RHOB|nr:AraC family transcriptional regulator [Ruegeria pomeroyi]MCE8540245.1 AraC family transcriptional regulator ligand-binding domain-containing protein [Ruegeria pomeroyi]
MSELPGVLQDLGANVEAIFDGSGIDPAAVAPDFRMPFRDLLELLDRAARMSNCPHLGLLFGARFEVVKHHGLIGELMHSAPTLKQALVDCVTWQLGYSSGAIVYLNRLGDEYAFGYASYEVSAPGTRVLYDVIVCIALRMLHELSNGEVKPVEAHFAYDEPANRAIYSKLLKLPVLFNQNRNCVIVDAAAMQITPPHANAEVRQRLLAVIGEAIWETKPSVSAKVGHAIRHLMHYEGPTMSAVARELGVHPRTLRRRLAAEGQTFEQLCDKVRYAVAREMLELTDIPVGEIGAFLSFASPGVFSNAFRRWSGMSPSAWRQQILASRL